MAELKVVITRNGQEIFRADGTLGDEIPHDALLAGVSDMIARAAVEVSAGFDKGSYESTEEKS